MFGGRLGQHCGRKFWCSLGDAGGRLTQGRTASCRPGAAEPKELIDFGLIGEVGLAHFAGNPSAFKDKDPVGQISDEVEVLFNKENGQSAIFAQRQKRFPNFLNDRRLNSLGRFIEEDEIRISHEAPRQDQQLLLAARERTAFAVQKHPQTREFRQYGFHDVMLGLPGILMPSEAQIVANSELREYAAPLGDIAKPQPGSFIWRHARDVGRMEPYRSRAGRQEPHDGFQQGRFAHAVVAENPNNLVFGNRELNPVKDRHFAVAAGQSLDFQTARHVVAHLRHSFQDRRCGR